MKKQDFKVTFLSDIVLNKTSNTQGKIENLDFITGSAFLGMAVSKMAYDFEIFHSGKIRFGEATPLFEGKESFKVPFSFFSPKLDLDNKEIKNNHFIDYEDDEELDKQYKQLRNGFMTKDLEYFELDFDYNQKSAYDNILRRSKDSTMFGYNAIKKGATWKFSLKFEDKIDISEVIRSLNGEHFLGKSKTSQYGRIQIEKLGEIETLKELEYQKSDTTYLYVNSSLALFDENGMPTFQPSKKSLGLETCEVVWEDTQVRTKIFTPYVYIRHGRDSSRLIIEKGSVIALKNVSQEDIKTLSKGIGGFLSEGYGEVLINPDFLLKEDTFSFKKVAYKYKEIQNIEANKDENLIEFLKAREDTKDSFKTLGDKVADFVKSNGAKYKKISSSQWGQIRMMAQFIKDKDKCVEEIKNFITHGTSSSKWENISKSFIDEIKKYEIDYIKLLAMKMAEISKKAEK